MRYLTTESTAMFRVDARGGQKYVFRFPGGIRLHADLAIFQRGRPAHAVDRVHGQLRQLCGDNRARFRHGRADPRVHRRALQGFGRAFVT